MLGAIPLTQQFAYHHPPIGSSGPYTSAQFLSELSLSLSLVVKYLPLWTAIGSVVVPWNPPTVSLYLSVADATLNCSYWGRCSLYHYLYNSRRYDSKSCRSLPWFLIWFQRFPADYCYQIRIYISYILRVCTKIYRNNSGSLIPDSRITWIQLVTSTWFLHFHLIPAWSHRSGSESWQTPALLELYFLSHLLRTLQKT